MCRFGVSDGNIVTQRRVQNIGNKPRKFTFFDESLKLLDAKVKIVIL